MSADPPCVPEPSGPEPSGLEPSVAADLTLARQGTGYYDRLLAELSDDELDEPSLLPGWDRRHVVAHVAGNARALARLVDWARTGVTNPMYPSVEARNAEIEAQARTSPVQLRERHRIDAAALAAAWRDLPAGNWAVPVRTAQGRTVPASRTAWMRVREVWLHAVDLGTTGRFGDFPPGLVDRLLVDVTGWWAASGDGAGPTLSPTDRVVPGLPVAGAVVVRGTAADLLGWATGRGTGGVTTGTGEPLVAPRWL